MGSLASSVAGGPRGRRPAPSRPLLVLWLEDLQLPEQHDPWELRQLMRRYRTLMSLDVAKTRQGGTGKALEVFNCYGERYCLKAMRPVGGMGLSARELANVRAGQQTAFEDEYRCHRAVNGTPGFPRLRCRGTYAGGPVILMDWIEGVSLATLMRQGTRQQATLSARDCAAVGAAIARSLALADERDASFAHRDISPKNVLLRTDRRTLGQQLASHEFDTCLLDFGSGVCASVHEGAVAGNRVWRNATLEYAPPEMLSHEGDEVVRARLSEKVDVYELCGVLYELYCGHTPFRLAARKVGSAFRFKSYFEAADPGLQSPEDRPLVDLLLSGLRADPSARPTVGQLLSRLQELRG